MSIFDWFGTKTKTADTAPVHPSLTFEPPAFDPAPPPELPVRTAPTEPEPVETQVEGKTRFHIGLLSTKDLKEFFESPFFAEGRQAGVIYKTNEALREGRQEVVNRFKFVVYRMIERKKVHLDHLKMLSNQIEGVSDASTLQIKTRLSQIELDVTTLNEQVKLSDSYAGWVATAITQYETGFRRGVSDALGLEHLL